MKEAENAPYRYGQIQIITGLAIGCWKGIYFWYLFAHLGLDASEVAILGCGQFILQLLLEIPSGTWAEREDPGNLLSLAYGAFLAFSLLYGVAGLLHVPSLSSIHALAAVHSATLVLAVVAECFFGAGTALLSGTLDAWVGEIERSAANAQESDAAALADFQQRLLRVKSYKFLSQGAARAVVGTATFFAALKLDHFLGVGIAAVMPWGLAAVLYVSSLIVVRRFVIVDDTRRPSVVTTLRNIHPWRGQGLANLGRYSRRAAAYLRESPETFRIVLVTALPMVAFWSTQAFSVAFLLKALGVSKSDDVNTWAGRIPLFVIVWAGAEFATAAGATLSVGRSLPEEGKGSRNARGLGALLLGFTAALAVQLGSVGMPRARAVKCFALAYVASKLLEGWVRKETDLLLEQSIVSERATHLSIESFIHAFLGLIFLAGTGYLMSRDPVSGYAFIFVVSAVGAVTLLAFPLAGTPLRTTASPRARGGWRPVVALAAGAAALTGIFIALNLAQVVGKPWMLLSRTSDSITATRISSQVVIPTGWRVWPSAADRTSPEMPHTKSSTWWLAADANEDVTCSVPDVPADDLVGVDMYGAKEGSVVLRYRQGSGTMFFTLGPHSKVEVSTSSDAAQPFECSAGQGESIGLVPVRVLESLQSSTTPLALWVEVLVGLCIVGALAWLGNSHSLRVLAEAQRLGPVASALKEGGHDPMKVWHPTLYLKSLRLPEELGRFAQELDVTSLVVGGFRLERRRAIHAWAVAFAFRDGAPQAPRTDNHTADPERMPAWVRGYIEYAMECSDVEGPPDDVTTRRYRQRAPASIDEWPVPGGPMDGSTGVRRTLFDRSPPFVAVACSVAKEGQAALFGFAGAVSSDRAERYVDPVGRSLLRMLAEVGLTQHRAAEFRFQMRGQLYDAADRMTQTRVHVAAVRDEARRDGEDVRVPAGQLDQLMQVTVDNELDMERALGKVPPLEGSVALRRAVEKERGLAASRSSRHQGRVRIAIDMESSSDIEIPSRTWAELRRVLFQQLLRGALFHGSSPSKPDVRFNIAIEVDGRDIRFTVVNDLPSDWQSDGLHRAGSGLATAGSIVQRLGGCWSGAGSENQEFVVRFSVPAETAGRASPLNGGSLVT